MAISPTGIIPEELLYPNAVAAVMQLLARVPVAGDTKAEVLLGWAQTVGVKISASQLRKVRETGTDRGGALTS